MNVERKFKNDSTGRDQLICVFYIEEGNNMGHFSFIFFSSKYRVVNLKSNKYNIFMDFS